MNKIHWGKYCEIYSLDNNDYTDVFQIIDSNAERILRDYNHRLQKIVTIKIYPDLETFHKNMWTNPPEKIVYYDWMIGCVENEIIKIVSPYNPGSTHNYNSVIFAALHEFLHVVIMDIFMQNNGEDQSKFMNILWLHEGLAVYESGQWKSFLDKIKNEIKNHQFPTLVDLNSGNNLYIWAWTAVKFIIEKYGRDLILSIIADYSNLLKYEPDFESKWQNWLVNNY